jgi:hypothetical protein
MIVMEFVVAWCPVLCGGGTECTEASDASKVPEEPTTTATTVAPEKSETPEPTTKVTAVKQEATTETTETPKSPDCPFDGCQKCLSEWFGTICEKCKFEWYLYKGECLSGEECVEKGLVPNSDENECDVV